jgi:GxxExxY protein
MRRGWGQRQPQTNALDSWIVLAEPPEHLDHLARAVIGAAIEVHRRLGPGFLESIYEAALVIELARRRIHFERQLPLVVCYDEIVIGEHRLDLLVEGELVVELKAVDAIAPIHLSQLLSYLRAGAFQLGLVINFNVPYLRSGIRRVVASL